MAMAFILNAFFVFLKRQIGVLMNALSSQQEFAMCQWRHQIALRNWNLLPSNPRSCAAFGYTVSGRQAGDLVELDQFVAVVVHYVRPRNKSAIIRLTGFHGSTVPWGVKWGGLDASVFEKDLALEPRKNANGRRLELKQPHLIKVALQVDRKLWDAAATGRKSSSRTQPLRLPKLWAAFDHATANHIDGAGPELQATCRRRRKTAHALMRQNRRRHLGYTLFPLNWVSQHWEEFAAVYVDLYRFPKVQVVVDELYGFRGACEFDFRRTRFTQRAPRRTCSDRRPFVAA